MGDVRDESTCVAPLFFVYSRFKKERSRGSVNYKC